jgi:hypothetical protein
MAVECSASIMPQMYKIYIIYIVAFLKFILKRQCAVPLCSCGPATAPVLAGMVVIHLHSML